MGVLLASAFIVVAAAGSSRAANAVIMESKWVESGGRDVQIGIYIANEDSLAGLVLPFEFRAIHVGAFITRALTIRANGRFAYLDSTAGDGSVIQKLYYPRKRIPTNGYGAFCPADSSGLVWGWSRYDSLPDFVGEEAMMYVAVPFRLMPPGDDILNEQSSPSLVLEFDVTETGGAFIIDTICTQPSNHLEFLTMPTTFPQDFSITPEFQRSIVLIGCDSECHGDPNCDGWCNIVDLVMSVSVAFKGAAPFIDPDPRCPTENTDVNCDMVTNVIDIVKMINVQYRGASLDAEFCAPCDHIPRTGNPKEDVRTPYFRNNGS
jgi:hypothetical protein